MRLSETSHSCRRMAQGFACTLEVQRFCSVAYRAVVGHDWNCSRLAIGFGFREAIEIPSKEVVSNVRFTGVQFMGEEDRMMKWFAFEHLPEHLKVVSIKFYEIACSICALVESGPERTVALRKLLEAKDAAVRATVNPGG